jgi:hypothetical protein
MYKLKIGFIAFLWLLNFSANASDVAQAREGLIFQAGKLTLNTMSPELSKEVMAYINSGNNEQFIKDLLLNSKDARTIPTEWEVFIVNGIINHNLGVIYGLDKIFESNLYKYLSQKYGAIFIRSNLLFSFVLDMENWTQKSASIVLRDSNYAQIEKVLMKALELVVAHHAHKEKIATSAQKIGFFIAHNLINLSSPRLAIVDKALSAAGGAPQQKMWLVASQSEFYKASNAVTQAEMNIDAVLSKNFAYQKARKNAVEALNTAQEMLKKMASDTVLKTVDKLNSSHDRGEASYKLANLYILALMVEYKYVSTYMTHAYDAAHRVLAKQAGNPAQHKILDELVKQMELMTELSGNPLIGPLETILSSAKS